jgi:hypothetical protein
MSTKAARLSKPKKPPQKKQKKHGEDIRGWAYNTRSTASKMADPLKIPAQTPLPTTPEGELIRTTDDEWRLIPDMDFGGLGKKAEDKDGNDILKEFFPEKNRYDMPGESGESGESDDESDEEDDTPEASAEQVKSKNPFDFDELVLLESDMESDDENNDAKESKEKEKSDFFENLMKDNEKDESTKAILIALSAVEARLRGEIRESKKDTESKFKKYRKWDKNWKKEYGERVISLGRGMMTTDEMRTQILAQDNRIKELEEALGQLKFESDTERLNRMEARLKDLATDVDNIREATRKAINKNAFLIQALQRRTREKNIRVQGIKPNRGETNEAAFVRTFKPVVPTLEIEHLEFVTKVFKKGFTYDPASGKPPPQPNMLIGFNSKTMRDLVFFDSKKEKKTLGDSIIVREDLIKRDLKAKELARDQMQAAWDSNPKKKAKFTYGYLVVEGEKITITNIQSLDRVQFPPKLYKD